MAGDRDIEQVRAGTMESDGTPLMRELDAVFKRHGFDGGFVYAAFALDGDHWRFDAGSIIDDSVPECERESVLEDCVEWVAGVVNDAKGPAND